MQIYPGLGLIRKPNLTFQVRKINEYTCTIIRKLQRGTWDSESPMKKSDLWTGVNFRSFHPLQIVLL